MSFDIPSSAVGDLVSLLIERGHFSDGVKPLLQHAADGSEEFMKKIQNEGSTTYALNDKDCGLVCSSAGQLVTRPRLCEVVLELVNEFGGRATLHDVAEGLQIGTHPLENAISISNEIQLVSTDLISSQYFDDLVPEIIRQLRVKGGQVSLSGLSQSFGVPMDVMIQETNRRLVQIGARMITLGGSKVLVSPAYVTNQKAQIRGHFRALCEPTSVRKGLDRSDWSYILTKSQ